MKTPQKTFAGYWGLVGLLLVCSTPLQAQLINTVAVAHDAEIVNREDTSSTLVSYDYGDAPDPSYPTLAASDGARHAMTGLFLGSSVDLETNGQPNGSASGDSGDEDGVMFTSPIDPGSMASVTVTSSGAGFLDAWIDFDTDGDWDEPDEQIFTSTPVSAGANALMFSVPAGASRNTDTFARFRLSSTGSLSPTGAAADGEVEDYQISTLPAELTSFSID